MSDQSWPPPLDWPARPLTDGVVLLDQLLPSDADRIVIGCTDADTQRWLPLPTPYGEVEAHSFVQSRPKAAREGGELTFAVRDAADGVLAGVIGLHLRGYRNTAEIGYWTAPDRRGRGWTARAVHLVARYAFTRLPLARVEILVAVDNVHSRRVATAVGATFEGVRRNGLPTGSDDDAAVYSLIPTDPAVK